MAYYSVIVDYTEDQSDLNVPVDFEFDWRFSQIYYKEAIVGEMSEQDKDSRPEDDLISSEYLGYGVIRLFKQKDNYEPGLELSRKIDDKDVIVIPGDDSMVCMLFVPSYFTLHELLHFYIGDDIINTKVSNIRMLKHYKKNANILGCNFMVLLKFKDPIYAKEFLNEFNGKKFSKMDPETCHIVAIKELVFKKTLFDKNMMKDTQLKDGIDDSSTLPYLLKDPFTSNLAIEENRDEIELPTCPVCLEKMDSLVTGLITIPCSHTFHCQCLDKWKNSKCPVCRHTNLNISRKLLIEQATSDWKCSVCDSVENLWMCLICGNVGCGRYNSKHAILHFEMTSHCFAMDMRTQRVWDYAGDNYVHRLVQNEVDGKLVEVGNIGSTLNTPSDRNKNENLVTNLMRNKEYHLEYVQVLISQLESQREYYELKLKDVSNKNNEEQQLQDLKDQLKSLKLQLSQNEQATKKELEANNMMLSGFQANLDKSEKFIDNLKQEKMKLEEENKNLQEQLQDLMFYLDTQNKFKDATEEEREGAVIIKQTGSTSTASKKKKNKKKKNRVL
ncbi:hypothetical protein TPHA_0C04250 [Tetrapisispora phaffii CBS 4417]|uniref:RING-type domain-containing protein n=1 Tax=Tetrapisispora phaffii (strain ATCC 24235 / CBS 4417 / NBRC 1672 / NRRL Y-8282 / UCD 70-5) TaxID=1071381 RepID=G8BQR3_TETPH|nr:hypothetical protein TPHA_0C04250 [Tetrapisispora phaffii CBS 4417]CCE62575.1 hypothetical protein TPHA_0C04250 [Tetrapisispora phaffii CBS 4417]